MPASSSFCWNAPGADLDLVDAGLRGDQRALHHDELHRLEVELQRVDQERLEHRHTGRQMHEQARIGPGQAETHFATRMQTDHDDLLATRGIVDLLVVRRRIPVREIEILRQRRPARLFPRGVVGSRLETPRQPPAADRSQADGGYVAAVALRASNGSPRAAAEKVCVDEVLSALPTHLHYTSLTRHYPDVPADASACHQMRRCPCSRCSRARRLSHQ